MVRLIALVVLSTLAISLAGCSGGEDEAQGGGGGGLSTLRTGDFHALAFMPDSSDGARVLFGHHNGLMQSADGGRTWRKLVDRENEDFMSIAISPARPQRIYGAGHDRFSVSDDSGVTWRPVAHDLPGTDIHALAVSPADPQRLYAFVVRHGLFRSDDGGAHWSPIGQLGGQVVAIAAGEDDVVWAAALGVGVARSEDGGRTWLRSSPPPDNAIALSLATIPGRDSVLVGTTQGLYRHKHPYPNPDWSRIGPDEPGQVMAVALSPQRPDLILALLVAGGVGRVYRSDDGGRTW